MSEATPKNYDAILQAVIARRLQNADLTDLAQIASDTHPDQELNHLAIRERVNQMLGTESTDPTPQSSEQLQKIGAEIVEEIFNRRSSGNVRIPD